MANFTDPLGTDQYSRIFTSAFDEREIVSVPTAGQTFFGDPNAGNSQTIFSDGAGVVTIDILRVAGEKLAKLIHRGGSGINVSGQASVNDEKFSTFDRTFPLIYDTGDLNAKQINEIRTMGENPFSGLTPMDRLQKLAMNMHEEIMRRVIRTCEYLSWQSLLTGTMPYIYGTTNTDLIIDFLRKSTHIYTVAVKWDNASAVILEDMDDAWDLGRQDAFTSYDGMVLGGDAATAFVGDSEIRDLADNRRIDLISIGEGTEKSLPERFKKFVDAGLSVLGKVRTNRGRTFYLFTYDDIYTTDAGVATPYMPLKKVLYFNAKSRCDRYFGPSDTLPVDSARRTWMQEMFGLSQDGAPMPEIKGGQIIDPRMFYHDAYGSNDGRTATIRTQAAPIFATTQTDAFVTQTVLT